MKTFLRLLLITPLLFAFQCDKDFESEIRTNEYKASVTPQANFDLDDIIWVNGYVSSNVFDLNSNDSIFTEDSRADYFSILKLIDTDPISNSKDAIDKFDVVFETGNFNFVGVCENSKVIASGELNQDATLYIYRLGLIPLEEGDYVISWQNPNALNNENRNEFIIENYPLDNHPNQIGFNECGNVSWRFLNESNAEFYFRVN